MSVSEVTVTMSTTAHLALEAYLKYRANKINVNDFQGMINTLGYKLDIQKREDEISLINNILLEVS